MSDRNKIVLKSFPQFTIGGDALRFVTEFKYLGHIIVLFRSYCLNMYDITYCLMAVFLC